MHFDSPWRLLTLAPFAALVFWLLIGLHQRTQIPFLSIWPSELSPPKRDRRVHIPPAAILLLLLAMLLTLVGLGQPVIRKTKPSSPQNTTPEISHAAIGSGQLMVRLSSPTDKPLDLVLQYDQTRETRILTPSDGPDYFLELSSEPEELRLSINTSAAVLQHRGAYPKIQSEAPLGASAQRVIASYENARKPSDNSPIVKISKSLAPDETGIVPGKYEPADGEPSVTDHPITANVHLWPTSGGEAPQGWTSLVKRNGKTLVALREDKNVRQVWLAMDFTLWDATPDFVIFWTNLLDYIGGATRQYAFSSVSTKPENSKISQNIELAPWLWSFACAVALLSSVLFNKKVS